MLRLRLGLGVGIKPDVIAFLVGVAGARETVHQIAGATGYYRRAVRRALEELVAAGFLEARPTAPVSFRADLSKWAVLLGIDVADPPAWGSWAALYAFVAAAEEWWRSAQRATPFVLASEARDLVAAHEKALELAGLRFPRSDTAGGEGFLEPFAEALTRSAEFIDAVV
jgi:hypothetical protein